MVTGLTNGDSYTFSVVATNANGNSAASAASTAITIGVPGAPTAVSAVPGNASETVSWTAPANIGAGPITSYTVKPNTGTASCTATAPATSCTVTGLTNKTSYTFTVTATNAFGTGAASSASTAVIAGIPLPPTNVTAVAGNVQAVITWTPSVNNGSAVTSYKVTSSTGSKTCTYTVAAPETDTCTVTALTNGTAYTFTVTATNTNGTSVASAASNSITPSTVPGAPTAVSAVAGAGQASVSFTAPTSNGGSAITGYTVTAVDSTNPANGGQTVSGAASPLTVTGLTNGDSYTFTVTATNVSGTGAASAASSAVTPSTVPDAPLDASAVAGSGSAVVSWVPGFNEGSAVTSYTVTATGDGGNQTCTYLVTTPETDTCTVSGLANTTSYTFTVTATNANGTGAASAPSNSVTPSTVPDVPTAVTAVAGNGQATVSWTPPANNEGSTITSYTVTANGDGGNETCTYLVTSSETDSCVVTGLTDGTAYTFTVTATNGNGTGGPSAASASVIPSTVPDAPTGVTAGPGNGSAIVTWTAPFDEGSAITSYTVTATGDSGNETCTYVVASPETDSCTVTGLSNGTAYTFTVTATNANGTGAASAASNSVTPAEVPDAPTAVAATPSGTSAVVTWTAPFDEGSAITSYTVTATGDGGNETCTYVVSSPETDSCTVSGLTYGTAYTFTVTATNANGTGAASAPSNSVTPSTVPDAPTGATATAGNGSASVSWTAPFDEGSAITSYTVTATDSTTPANGGQTASGSASPISVTGLTNGDSYTFTVTATNGDGAGDPSDGSNSVTPSAVPDAPTGVTASAGDTSATVGFTAPSSEGSDITGYTVTATDSTTPANGGQTVSGAASPITVTGLTNGDSYTFTVTATNGDGTGSASAASAAVVPSTVPDAPTGVAATAGDSSASVSFAAPSDEGSDITGYTVTATDSTTPADGGQTASGSSSPITVTGLTNGDSYTFTVVAINGDGTGPVSAASNSVAPSAVPDAPTGVAATAGNSSASVTWTAPSDEGSPITGYTVTATDSTDVANGGQTVSSATAPVTVTGLTNGDSYTFTVTATNSLGSGIASAASPAVVPSTVPDAPTGVVATAGDSSAVVGWNPAGDEGSPITGYTVTTSHSTATCTTATTFCTVTGLANNTAYTFTVTATNADGTGAASLPSNSVTPTGNSVPAFTSAATDAVAAGKKVNFSVTATGSPAPTISESGTLPSWLTFKPGKKAGKPGTLSGTAPATSGGSYTFTLTADNGTGTPTTQTFVLNVLRITSAATANFTVGQAGSFEITTTDTPANPTLTAKGLPAGLSFTDNGDGTGTISGTPGPLKKNATAKAYSVKVTATAGGAVAAQTTLVIVVAQ